MEDGPFASRLAERFRWPIVLIGGASAVVTVANLASWVTDRATIYAAAGVGVIAVIMFVCAIFDMRFQRAVAAVNADRESEAKRRGWLSRLTGAGLPMGDRPLLAINILQIILVLFVANVMPHGPAAALSFAGFFLVCMTRIALFVRG
jgi:hypothetical protein